MVRCPTGGVASPTREVWGYPHRVSSNPNETLEDALLANLAVSLIILGESYPPLRTVRTCLIHLQKAPIWRQEVGGVSSAFSAWC